MVAETTQPRSRTYSFVHTYDPEDFLDWDAWDDVRDLLHGKGTCCGLGGARGAGKTWLLQEAVAVTKRHGDGGVGVYFPSPSAYNTTEFLSGLCLNLAIETATHFSPHENGYSRYVDYVGSRQGRINLIAAVAAIMILFYWLLSIGYYAAFAPNLGSRVAFWIQSWGMPWLLTTAFLSVLLINGPQFVVNRKWRLGNEGKLYYEALAMRDWIEFSRELKSTSEFAFEAGKGLAATGRVSEERARKERPVTDLALVTGFRRLAERITATGTPLVVAIDELDKIGVVDDVRALLRTVKGVLDPRGVVLLVSISDEAITHLGLAGIRGRDEFSSAFSRVLEVRPLPVTQTRDLLVRALGFQSSLATDLPDNNDRNAKLDEVAMVLNVATAGNPRETLRLFGEYMSELSSYRNIESDSGHLDFDAGRRCALVVAESETRDFVRALRGNNGLTSDQNLELYEVIHSVHPRFASGYFPASSQLMRALDAILDTQRVHPWPELVLMNLHRLLIRLAVLTEIYSRGDRNGVPVDGTMGGVIDPATLRDLLEINVTSPGVAELMAVRDLKLFDGRRKDHGLPHDPA